jgi:DNA primase
LYLRGNVIPQAIIDKVFDAAAIEEVVGEYVSLKKAGKDYKGLCPFHDDKKPSMSVSPSKGIYKCFACDNGGNVFKFIMEHEGMSYPMAVKFLAEKYNIPIEEEDVDFDQLEDEARKKDGIYACLEFAKKHFYSRLNESQDGKVIYKPYLLERGLSQFSIDTFSIGLSGTGRTDLLEAGLQNGYTAQQLFDAGLVKKVDEDAGIVESNLRDTFIERIVFPIHSISGKVLGFGGRVIKKDTKAPKYLNSPETLVYEKRKQLFGLNLAKNVARKEDDIFLVEGYMDVVSLYQNGVENVVAASGTAFTPEQARLVKRFSANVTLLFDGDEAGIKASLKHISTLLAANVNVYVVLFPDGEDPDSFIQKNGTEVFKQYVAENAKNAVEVITAYHLGDKPNDPIRKAEAARQLAESIAAIPDPLKRSTFITEGSSILGIDANTIANETNRFRVKNREQQERAQRLESPAPLETPVEQKLEEDKTNYQEQDLLKTLIRFSDREMNEEETVAEFIFKELIADEVWPSQYKEVFDDAYGHLQEQHVLNELYFIKHPQTNELAATVLASKYRLSDGWEKNYDKFVKTEEENYKIQVKENLNYYKLKCIDTLMEENQEEMRNAETDDEIMVCQRMHVQLQEIRRQLTDEIGTVIVK